MAKKKPVLLSPEEFEFRKVAERAAIRALQTALRVCDQAGLLVRVHISWPDIRLNTDIEVK